MGRYEDQGGIQGILEEGFGPIARKVMRDPRLSIGAKGLYSYLVSFAGAGLVTWPRKTTICKELGIHKETYNKYLTQLIELDYVRITPRRDSKGQFLGNLYTIVAVPNKEASVNTSFPPDTEKTHTPKKPDMENNRIRKITVYGKKPDTEKTPMHNTNSLFNINIKQQHKHLQSNFSSNNAQEEQLNFDADKDEATQTGPNNDSSHKEVNNDQKFIQGTLDIEKKIKQIQERLLTITGVEVDGRLISLLCALSEDKRENIIEAIAKYLKNNTVNSVDGLVATAIREGWQPGKKARKKKEREPGTEDKFLCLYQGSESNIDLEEFMEGVNFK